ncbi:hypothetical protein [Pseudoalteromonas sp. T1lg75]|uniref:hypothetical protein n=1 Tax=Pseudoalteromonas sp. T1lg75 TaxID=2077102 RepID=UPI000CF6C660|nr:hypothetical protein [Pseudoalteromonas sp. T1lg75]
MSTEYNGLEFKTELEAIWAAFFDLAGWQWWYNPVQVENWKPDFKVTFPCGHSECGGSHTLLVSVLPTRDLNSQKEHPSLLHSYGVANKDGKYLADGGALFGIGPLVTQWQIVHGSGGGIEDVHSRVHNANELWDKAAAAL